MSLPTFGVRVMEKKMNKNMGGIGKTRAVGASGVAVRGSGPMKVLPKNLNTIVVSIFFSIIDLLTQSR